MPHSNPFKTSLFVNFCVAACLSALLILLVACGGAKADPGPSSPTISASAASASITAGQSTMLTWTTTNATGVTIDNGIGNQAASGSVSVSPTATTSYHLTAVSPSGATATTSVTVSVAAVPAPTAQFSANPTTIISGQPTTLTWTTTNANSVSIDNGIGSQSTSGSFTVKPTTTTTYNLTATSASGATATASVTVTVNAPAPTIQFSASSTAIISGQSPTLQWTTANATGFSIDSGIGSQQLSGIVHVSPIATTTYTATASGPGGTTTAKVTITVSPSTVGVVPVTMHHNDLAQTGVNAQETILTPANVNTPTFGKKYSYPVDGQIYGQPLYLPNLTINGLAHNTVFVATEHDSVYAFDANGGGQLWKVSLGTAVGNTDPEGIEPVLGITSTMVIDPNSGSLYVTAVTSGRVLYLHKLDVLTGKDQVSPVTVQASVPGTGSGSNNGMVSLSPSCYQRTALTLANGRVYLGFGHCNHGWVLAYDAASLAAREVFNTSPNGIGATIWEGGGGFAVDGSGNLYLESADDMGTSPPNQSMGSYPDAFLKLSRSLQVLDYFIPSNEPYLSSNDADIGSGAPILLPNNELVGGGKDGRIFVLDTTNLGKFNSQDQNVQTIQTGTQQFDNIWGAPAFWNGVLYYHDEADVLRAYGWNGRTLTTKSIASGNTSYSQHGASPSISANGTSNGIIWDIDNSGYNSTGGSPAVLHAYDATNLTELYNSSQAPNGHDTAGNACKFSIPTIADGNVFVPTSTELDIYGLFP